MTRHRKARGVGYAARAKAAPAAQPHAITKLHPLTPAQRRAWFRDPRAPGGPSYIIPRAYRLRGSLDGDALARALDVLVMRHPALRTTFALFEGSPAQRVAARGMASYSRHDLAGLDAASGLRSTRRLMRAEGRRRFDIERGPMLRAVLAHLAPDDHVLLLAAPAIAADEWSVRLLWRELGEAYGAALARRPVSLAPPDDRLTEIARAAADAMSQADDAADAEWWHRTLTGAAPARLHRDGPPVLGHGASLASATLGLSPGDTAPLRALAREERASLFMVLVTALAAVLKRLTDQADLLIGAPAAHRTHPDFEALVGPYATTLAMRIVMPGAPTLRQLLRRVRDVALDAYAHAGPAPPGVDCMAAVSATISLDDSRDRLPALAGLDLEAFPVGTSEPQSALDVRFSTAGGGLEAVVAHRAQWSNSTAIDRTADHLASVLRELAHNPDQTTAHVPRAGGSERRQLLSMGRGPVQRTDGRTLASLLDERCARSPEAVVIERGDESRTCCELRTEVASLAAALGSRGIAADRTVAVLAADPIDELALTMGVIAGGAACFALESAPPAGIGRGIHAASADLLVIGRGRDATDLPDSVATLAPDAMAASPGIAKSTPLAEVAAGGLLLLDPDDERSDALLVAHSAIANAALWQRTVFPVRPEEATWCSGQRILDVLVSLLAGGSVLIGNDPGDVAGRLSDPRIKWARLDSALLDGLLSAWEAGAASPGPALRGLVVASERPAAEVAQRCRRALRTAGRSDVGLHFVSAGSSGGLPLVHWRTRPGDDDCDLAGRPVSNSRLYVVDDAGALCPRGLPGEVWAGGAPIPRLVAEGGAGSAARVRPDPFTLGGTVVRTGLRARWTADGTLQWLGHVTDIPGDARGAPSGRLLEVDRAPRDS